MRYNGTSRIGVSKTDLIVIENLNWIFREQPIADVGIDGIIEQVEDNEPTGKFIAVQIKTGLGNFYKSGKSLVLYVSNIHYNYWLNLCIPIILVAHLPEDNVTLWQEINEKNFKRAKKKWKIEIPLNQGFNEKSKNRLIKILSHKNDRNFDIYKGIISEENEYDISEKISGISEATKCMLRISEVMNEQTDKTKLITKKIESFIEMGLSSDSLQVSSVWKGFSVNLNITSSRLENEINIFSQVYSQGIFSFENLILILKNFGVNLKDLSIDDNSFQSLKNITNEINQVIEMMSNLRESIKSLNINHFGMKESNIQYIEVVDLMLFEMEAAKKITNSLILNLEI